MRADATRGISQIGLGIGLGLILLVIILGINDARVTDNVETQEKLPDSLIGSFYVQDPRTRLCFLIRGSSTSRVPCNEEVQRLVEKSR